MRPKGKLFALLAIFAAIGLVTATGAFTSVSAERTANVTVAGDADALLALQPFDGPNGEGAYANLEGEQLEISLSGSFGGEQTDGVNQNASTEIRNVFNISNNGAQNVDVHITKTGDNNHLVNFYTNGTIDEANNITSSGNAKLMNSGDTISISIYVNTTGHQVGPGDEILSDITIHANDPNA